MLNIYGYCGKNRSYLYKWPSKGSSITSLKYIIWYIVLKTSEVKHINNMTM